MNDYPAEPSVIVDVGTWVGILGNVPNDDTFEQVFHFVLSDEVDLLRNRVSIDSPFGRALAGATAGDEVVLETAKGPLEMTVLEVGRGRDSRR